MRIIKLKARKGLLQPAVLCYIHCNDERIGEFRLGQELQFEMPDDTDIKIHCSSPTMMSPVISNSIKFTQSSSPINLLIKAGVGGLFLESKETM
jgi:hypothetical protein